MMRREAGFSIIELIMFIIIAGIVVPMTYVAFTNAMKGGTKPEDYTKARLVAEETMELAKKRGFAQLTTDIVSPPSCTTIGVTVPAGYTCSWTPSVYNPGYTSTNYIQIYVRITGQHGDFDTYGMVTNHAY